MKKNTTAGFNLNSTNKKAAVAVGAGIVLGTAGAFGAAKLVRMGDDDDDVTIVDEDGLQFATGVKDSMSFEEAFDTARDEVGEGGCFIWHGKIYSTYTSEEWDNLSAEEKSKFAVDAFGDDLELDSQQEKEAPAQASATTSSGASASKTHAAKSAAETQETQTAKTTAQATTTTTSDDEDEDDDIHVISVQQESIEGTDVITAETVEHGVHYTYIDVNLDEKFDLKFSDSNQDGVLQENEVEDISNQNVTVGKMVTLAAEHVEEVETNISNYQAEVETLPDYTNDADVSDIA